MCITTAIQVAMKQPTNGHGTADRKSIYVDAARNKKAFGGDRPLVVALLLLFFVSHAIEDFDWSFWSSKTATNLGSTIDNKDQQSMIVSLVNQSVTNAMNQIKAATTAADAAADNAASPDDFKPSSLPTCKSLMQTPNSPYKGGYFLTRHSQHISWHPRADGSRELQHELCGIHRYTAEEARFCLAPHHVHFIGDSITRYQMVSLVHLLHHGKYPPRFGFAAQGQPCAHVDETGQEQCSPPDKPNINMEREWTQVANMAGKDPWLYFMQALGTNVFDGYMEASAVRTKETLLELQAENYLYVLPESKVNNRLRPMISYAQEIGWAEKPTPIHGFHFTGCAHSGTCNYTDEMADERLQRALNHSFDFEEPLEQALQPNGALYKQLPPTTIAIYNRGHWGQLPAARANVLMPLLHTFSQGSLGRCYFKSTTTPYPFLREHERTAIRDAAWTSGCGFLDWGHITEDFLELPFQPNMIPPEQVYGPITGEREQIFWDQVHFQPWVNEEFNNLLLNILCNRFMPL